MTPDLLRSYLICQEKLHDDLLVVYLTSMYFFVENSRRQRPIHYNLYICHRVTYRQESDQNHSTCLLEHYLSEQNMENTEPNPLFFTPDYT